MDAGFFADGYAQVGVNLALLNGVLHVLWSSGLLDLDARALLPEGLRSLLNEGRLEARLPPVLRRPRAGEADDLILSLGQVELALTSDQGSARFGVHAEVGVDLVVADNRVTVALSETPTLHVWPIGSADQLGFITSDVLETLVLALWPDLRQSLGGLLAIELPIPPLDALGTIAPDLAGLRLRLDETGDRPRYRGDMVLLEGALTGVVEP